MKKYRITNEDKFYTPEIRFMWFWWLKLHKEGFTDLAQAKKHISKHKKQYVVWESDYE